MKTSYKILSAITVVMVTAVIYIITAQTKYETSADAAVQKGVNDLKKIISADNYKQLGFESVQQAQEIILGNQIEVFLIRLDSMKKYESGNGGRMLIASKRLIYPVLAANNSPLTSIEVDKNDNKWEARSFGNQHMIKSYIENLGKINNDTIRKTFLLRIPSLSLEFISSQTATATYVTYLGKNEVSGMVPGVKMFLDDALNKIKPMADKHNGLPW